MAHPNHISDSDLDFVAIAEAVARQLLGEPNVDLSTETEKCWGKHGSLKLDVATGGFFDHENKVGGGVLWFVERETGETVEGGKAADWLLEQDFSDPALIDRTRRKRSRRPRRRTPRPSATTPATTCLAACRTTRSK